MLFLSLVLSFVALSSALTLPRTNPSTPANWSPSLEPHNVYATRFNALGCAHKNTHGSFYHQCCHPMKANQSLSSRPAQCDPAKAHGNAHVQSSSLSSSPVVSPTPASAPAPVVDIGNDDCGGDDEPTSTYRAAPTPSPSSVPPVAPTPTPPPKPSPSPTSDDEDDLPYCDELGDDGDDSGAASTSIPSPTSSPSQPPKPVSSLHSSSAPPPPPPHTSSTPPPPPPTPSSPPPPPPPPPTPTSTAQAQKETPAADSSDSGVNTGGFATFFYQNGNPGACGQYHSDNDLIAAMDQDRFGLGSVNSPLCGKQVQITNTQNGKTVTVTIEDDCPTCNNGNSIDLSVGAFQRIASLDQGIVPISWRYVS